MKNYIANGVVYGKLWGGGYGAYPARKIEAKTKTELLKKAKTDLKSGSLDSGMGFEYLKGAILIIKEIESIIVKGKEFKNSEYIEEFIGDLTEKEKDFLLTLQF